MRRQTSRQNSSLRRFTRTIPGNVLAVAWKVPELYAQTNVDSKARSLGRWNVRFPGNVPAVPLNVLLRWEPQVARDGVNAEKDISQFAADFGYDE